MELATKETNVYQLLAVLNAKVEGAIKYGVASTAQGYTLYTVREDKVTIRATGTLTVMLLIIAKAISNCKVFVTNA